jgi:hypothetical protein
MAMLPTRVLWLCHPGDCFTCQHGTREESDHAYRTDELAKHVAETVRAKSKLGLPRDEASLKVHTLFGTHNPERLYSIWHAIVKEFTSRELTVPTDLLPALSALAGEFALVAGDTYAAGLCRRELPHSLAWTRSRTSLTVQRGYAGPTCREVEQSCRHHFDAPSWSWASTITKEISLPINLANDPASQPVSITTVLDIDISLW